MAALSAINLAALILTLGLRQLYIAQDIDSAGLRATAGLATRAEAEGINVWPIVTVRGDLIDDLRSDGAAAMRTQMTDQLAANNAMSIDLSRPW